MGRREGFGKKDNEKGKQLRKKGTSPRRPKSKWERKNTKGGVFVGGVETRERPKRKTFVDQVVAKGGTNR